MLYYHSLKPKLRNELYVAGVSSAQNCIDWHWLIIVDNFLAVKSNIEHKYWLGTEASGMPQANFS